MREDSSDHDSDEFVPWHERQPWSRGVGHAVNAVELASLVVLVALFGVGGLIFWLCGGTLP